MDTTALQELITVLQKENEQLKKKLEFAERHIGSLQYQLNKLDADFEPYEQNNLSS